jgi:hypothetical protein
LDRFATGGKLNEFLGHCLVSRVARVLRGVMFHSPSTSKQWPFPILNSYGLAFLVALGPLELTAHVGFVNNGQRPGRSAIKVTEMDISGSDIHTTLLACG